MTAMAFIYQHDQVVRGVEALRQFGSGVELVNQRENDSLGT